MKVIPFQTKQYRNVHAPPENSVLWTQAWTTGTYVSVSLLPIPQISTTTINRAANDRSYRGEPLVGNIASNPRSPLTLDTYYVAPTYGSGNKGLYYGEADVAAGTYTVCIFPPNLNLGLTYILLHCSLGSSTHPSRSLPILPTQLPYPTLSIFKSSPTMVPQSTRWL